jgi:hypothetical protein
MLLFQSRGSQLSDFEDPVRFVFRTWPWREDVAGLPQALRPVIGQGGPDSGSGSVNPRSRFKTTDHGGFVKNDDPLVNFRINIVMTRKNNILETNVHSGLNIRIVRTPRIQ